LAYALGKTVRDIFRVSMPGLVGKGLLQGLHVSGLVSMLQGIGINISYGC
jgi:hypothetical protein